MGHQEDGTWSLGEWNTGTSQLLLLSCVIWPQHELDSYNDRFQSAEETAQALLDTGHEASEEVQEKVGQLNGEMILCVCRCVYRNDAVC